MQDLLSILDSSCQNKFLENFLSLRTIAENGMTLVELIDTKRELLITLSLVHSCGSISISKKNSNGIYAYENGKTFNNKHNVPSYNNDVQVGNYLVEQRGEGHDLELTFLYQNKQTGRLNHYATYHLEGKSFETHLNYRHRFDPDWQTILKKQKKLSLKMNIQF